MITLNYQFVHVNRDIKPMSAHTNIILVLAKP